MTFQLRLSSNGVAQSLMDKFQIGVDESVTRVETPFTFPGGEHVAVLVTKKADGNYIVSDGGRALLAWYSLNDAPKLLPHTARLNGCQVVDGCIHKESKDLPHAVWWAVSAIVEFNGLCLGRSLRLA